MALNFERLHDCLVSRRIDDAKALVTRENAKDRDWFNGDVVWTLCEKGPDDPELLHYFLSLGCTLDLKADMSYLHIAAWNQNVRLMRELIDLGVPINIEDWNKKTPIFIAWRECKEKSVLTLYDAGARFPPNLFSDESEPSYLFAFRVKREDKRSSAVAVLCLKRCGSRVIGASNGNDVLRMIARCVWATRGH